MSIDLTTTCTQAEFGQLVGISQQAVSELLARAVLDAGQPVGAWLLTYTSHLREQAAGRGGDGELAANRAEESRVRRELLEIKLAERRKEVAPVTIIDQVLAHIGSQIRSHLEALPSTLKMRCPQLGAEAIKLIETEIFTTCNLAASAGIASLTLLDTEDTEATV